MNRQVTRKSRPVTFALVSRIFIGELPYIKSWLNHYKTLGINTIYLIITDKLEADTIKLYLAAYTNIAYIISDKKTIKMTYYKPILSLIKEEYTLFLDIDEYLDLDGQTLAHIVKEEPGDKFHFHWLMTVNDGISDSTKGFLNIGSKNSFKTMCKTVLIKEWKNSHNFKTISYVEPVISKYNIIHMFGRSFNDMLIKCFYGNIYRNKQKNNSNTDLKRALKSANPNDIPNRLKMMAVISRVNKPVLLNDEIIKHIKYDLAYESTLLNMIRDEEKSLILAKYNIFRNSLEYKSQVSNYLSVGLRGVNFDDLKI